MEQKLSIRNQFPFFAKRNVAYLDSAATSQKPQVVLDTIQQFYEQTNANVHRGVYSVAEEATQQFEQSRKTVAEFINANTEEIIFTRNTTEAINLVARSFGLQKGDVVLVTQMEHHSNIVPWQLSDAEVRWVPVTQTGELNMDVLSEELAKRPKLLAITHMSNALGVVNPIKDIVAEAHKQGVKVLVDGAQSIVHMPIDVNDLDCDFFAFSGHKLFGPMGIGVLYGKKELLTHMSPFLGGGEMIKEVTMEKTTFNELPWKFEAGTPNVAGAIGLAAAIKFIQEVGYSVIQEQEQELIQYTREKLANDPHVTLYGPEKTTSVISFNLGDMHAHDVTNVLDEHGVCLRSGHHCTQPLMDALDITATVRLSVSVYNTKEDIDRFLNALKQAEKVFQL